MRYLGITKLKQRLGNGFLALLFIAVQFVAVATPFINSSVVEAAPVCTIDTAGPNDPSGDGQKDLTRLCVDYAGVPTTISTTWNWDETSIPGGNTLDACNLFDTNNNGYADYAVCVTAGNSGGSLVIQATTTYSCSDSKIDRCASPSSVVSNGGTTCTVTANVSSDPFPAGDNSPNDTQGSCAISLAAVGGSATTLIDVCSYPSASPTSVPSDCVIARPSAGKLEVRKDLVPDDINKHFNLQVDGSTKVTTNGDGTTGEAVVSAGNHSVGETAGSNTSLSDYTSTISCRDANGTGSVIASGNGTSLANVPITDGTDVVCIITNTLQTGTITLVKNVVNNNGGQAAANSFGLTIGGNATTSGQAVNLTPGSYTINETQLPGYAFVSITGTGCPAQLGGSVNLTNGQDIVCTITNDDVAPTLTLVKTVTNDDGGEATTANFQGKIDGTNVAWETAVPVSAGVRTASESVILPGGLGYTASAWSGDCAADGTVTLTLGENATCYITNNDDAPSLHVSKRVLNDNGGTVMAPDFDLYVNGSILTDARKGGGDVDDSGITYLFGGAQAGVAYTVTETQKDGYTNTSFVCTDDATNQVVSHPVTLALGQSVSCEFVNEDIAPFLTVIKQALNPYGDPLNPSSFPLFVNGQLVTSGEANELNVGQYTITETQQPGYEFTGVSGDCSLVEGVIRVVLALGDNAVCTLTNTAIQPKLIVKKVVINDNSGINVSSDFTMNVSGNSQSVANFPGSEAGTEIGLNEGSYSVDEVAHGGYIKTLSDDCAGTISIGEVKTCTITNNDVAHPAINIDKNGPLTAHEGDEVTYTFDVTNTGDTATLSGVTVTDTIGNEQSNAVYESGDDGDGLLEKNEVWRYSITYVIEPDTDSVFNTGVACAFDPDQTKVCDDDTHTLTILHPGIRVQKDGPATASPGDTVTYTFTVTNIGDTPLDITKVSDSIAGAGEYVSGDANENELLDISEVWIYEVEYTIPGDQDDSVINIVDVCAEDGLEEEVCDDDTHTLVVLGKVIVTKYNDYNRNGIHDNGEPLLPNWEFNLTDGICDYEIDVRNFLAQALDEEAECYDKTQLTTQDGTTTFTEVNPNGFYQLTEALPADSNWNLGNIECNTNDGGLDGDTYYLSINSGQTVSCMVGNYRDAELLIEKTNDSTGDQVAGDVVTYTLVVTVPEDSGAVYDAVVRDLPPAGFTYVPGSWTSTVPTEEPAFNPIAEWHIGDLLPGDSVTLTYQMQIDNTVDAGRYTNIAYAQGDTVDEDAVVESAPRLLAISQATLSGTVLTTSIVSSSVVVAGETGEILGVTTVLANTGENMWAVIATGATIILMTISIGIATRTQQKGAN